MKKLQIILILVILLTACHSVAGKREGLGSQIEASPTPKLSLSSTSPPPASQIEFELLDTSWILTSIEGRELITGTQISLQISPEFFEGSAGCNRYGAKYVAESRHSFTIGELAINEADCIAPEGVIEQEERYTELLLLSTTYEILTQELSLKNEQGEILLHYQPRPKFDTAPEAIVGKSWQLVVGPDIAENQVGAFTLIIENEHNFSGTTVCREYQGQYQASQDEIRVMQISMTTDYNCSERDGLAEGRYTTYLENAEQYNVLLERLELFTRHGEKLVFDLVPDEK